MLAITEKWDPHIHGYCNPPDNPRKNNIMETMNFCTILQTDPIQNLKWFLECMGDFERYHTWGRYGRNIKLNIIKSTYKYNSRLFVIINKSFLNFIKKCKNYYKNKILHYKKKIFHRSIYGKFPLFKYPRGSE